MIVEDDGGASIFGYKKQHVGSPSNNPPVIINATNDYAINLMRGGVAVDVPYVETPMEIVSDESYLKQSSATPTTPSGPDPLVNFQRFASDLLSSNVVPQQIVNIPTGSNAPSSATNFDPYYYSYPIQQMAASSAVGGSPTAMFVNPTTPTSTPSSSTVMTGKKETVLSSRTISFITLQLRRVLNRMKIQYRDLAPPYDGGMAGNGGGGDDSAGNSRRVSLESDDGTKLEIGVSPAENAYGLNRVDFRCVEGDYGRYQELCSEVLAGLNL